MVGFRCYMCRELFSWDMLMVLHELNHCPHCYSLVLTKIKKQKELISMSRLTPDETIEKKEDEEWQPIKVIKGRGKKK